MASTNTTTVGQYSTDITSVQYIPTKPIAVSIYGLKPLTRVSVFFDKINVTSYCAQATVDAGTVPTQASDYHLIKSIGSAITTDSAGSAHILFYVPRNTFQVGTRELHVFDYTSSNDTYDGKVADHTCEAFAYYRVFNHSSVDAENNAIISTIPAGSTSSVTLSSRGSGTSTAVDPNAPRFDPLCQTFYIGSDLTKGKDGVYIKSVNLYFSAKSANQPISIDIRTVSNGIPTSTILPYSSVTLTPSQVNTSLDGATATTFTFKSPVYLRSGYTYALGISPGGQTPDYVIWTGAIGGIDSVNGRVNGNWGQGTLYTSTRGSTWTAVQNEFLKFSIAADLSTYYTSGTATFINQDLEFLTYSTLSTTNFVVGEYVYQEPSPLGGRVSVNTSSNTITFNVAASAVSTNLASTFVVNDHILILGSTPGTNTTHRTLNWGIFSNCFSAKVTSVDALNNTLQFAFANGATAVAPWANAAAVFYKPAKGTVSLTSGSSVVVGTGTKFDQQYSTNFAEGTALAPLVAQWSNGTFDGHEVLWPSAISNATYMTVRNAAFYTNATAIPLMVPVGKIVEIDYNRNMIILEKSTANASSSNTAWQDIYNSPSYFAPSRVLVGSQSGATALIENVVDVLANAIQPVMYQTAIQGTNINYSVNAVSKVTTNVDFSTVSSSLTNYLSNNEIVIKSKTNEINQYSQNKSFKFTANLTSSSNKVTPAIDVGHSALLVKSYSIGPDASNEYTNQGTALSKSVSKVITLGDGMDAEDLNVYLTAYKPTGSDIQVFAKLWNATDPDNFDDKKWTPLIQVTDANLYSDKSNLSDYKEFQYTIPTDPNTSVVSGQITTNNSTVITSTNGNTVWQTLFTNGQSVVLYSDVGMLNYEVHTISTVDSNTQITLTTSVGLSNTSAGLLASMNYPEAGYKNSLNSNIVRYHSADGSAHDSYKKFAIKIVLLSSNTASVPKVADMRTLALSV